MCIIGYILEVKVAGLPFFVRNTEINYSFFG